MTSYTETEVKLHVPDLDAVKQRLARAEAKPTAPRIYERNVRYENAEKGLTARGIVVRLRQDERIRLTYKDPGTVSDGILSRFEAEVEVDDFEAMQTILGKLGYFPHIVYEKYRTSYELAGAEIVLDEMPYGNFVEIEGQPATIEQLITQLGLGDARRMDASYLALFDRVKHKLGLEAHDLTFAAFEGISVPPEAFET